MATPTASREWQLELGNLPSGRWDATVIGAGPAGSICALHLARSGHRVLLVERQRFPRDKACGDLLIPDSLAALRRAGVYDRVRRVARPLPGATVSSPSRIEWPVEGEFLTLRRRELDAVLAESAAVAGATVVRGTAQGVENEERGVRVNFREGRSVESRVGVVATGADVSLLEPLGMIERKAPSAVALRAYLSSASGPERLLISFDRSIVPGYGWIFPLPGGEYNVGVGTLFEQKPEDRPNLKALLDRFLMQFPEARTMMDGGARVGEMRGARLRCGLTGTRAFREGRLLAIGEAIGSTYPFTGEGIGKAMETGELAARAIGAALSKDDVGELAEYPRGVEAELSPRYGGYHAAQAWCSFPILNDLLAWRVGRSGYLQRKAAEMVAESSDPREAVSVRGLLRSFWS
jgi:menaquinone-9 beta-reductase